MASPIFTPGRIAFILGNMVHSFGAYMADWNETHVKNPNWPPHARFHNGQTMSLGVCLATASLYFAFRPSLPKSTISPKESVFVAAVIGSFYCLAGLSAILYPGTDWYDPGLESSSIQKVLFPATIGMMWIGYFLEVSRLDKTKTA